MGKGGRSFADKGEDRGEFELREQGGKTVISYFKDDKVKKSKLPVVTMAEVAKHNKPDDLWIVIRKKAYNLTKWQAHHPGGVLPLMNMAGKDSTDAFIQYHPAYVWAEKLGGLECADVVGPEVEESEFVKEHRAMRQKLLERNLYETNYMYYIKKAAFLAFVFAAAIYIPLNASNYYVRIFSGLLLGLFWQQLAFLGHDAGHNAITHVQFWDMFIGLFVGNIFGGVSIAWWKRSHNVHHIVCNSIEHDPDIQHLPFLAIQKEVFQKPFWSSYHAKKVIMDPIAKFFLSYQHYLYYIIMGFARFNLYVQSWLLILDPTKIVMWRIPEVFGLSIFLIWMYNFTMSFSSNGELAIYMLLAHAFAGILHIQITLSHFAMDIYSDRTYTNPEKDGWFHTQLSTTLDIKSDPVWTDWFHGGLQFQVIHHVFPRLPRQNLRQARVLLMAFCLKHNIKYEEMGWFEANLKVWRKLRDSAMAARNADSSSLVLEGSMLHEGFMLKG